MVLENNEDLMSEELDKMKSKLKNISKHLETQQQLLRLIVQVLCSKSEKYTVDLLTEKDFKVIRLFLECIKTLK